MAIAGNDLSRFQSGPEIVRNGLVAEIATNLLLHLLQPVEDFLIGSAKLVSGVCFGGVERETNKPCSGPARPLRPAESESMGELRALPTKCVV